MNANRYQIENAISAVTLGTYEGDTPEAALSALAADAGSDVAPLLAAYESGEIAVTKL